MKFLSTGVDFNGVEDFVGVDDETGKIVLKRVCHDVEPLLDRNKALEADARKAGSMKHVASIPFGLVEMWKVMYGVDPTARGQERLLTRLLNDPDLRYLRTAPGRVDFKESVGG